MDGNLIIQGDNLHALKALLPLYADKVDCIFIDPPYNTGNEGWCYNDRVNSPMMREWLSSNPVGIGDGLRHDKWLAMMWPRLRLLRELLSDNGGIFVTIDDNELHRLRAIMDDIFGAQHFLANFVWQSKDTPGNNSTGIAETHNYVLLYRKSDSFAGSLLERNEEQRANYTNLDNDQRGDWLAAPLTRAEFRERDYYPLENLAGQRVWPPKGSSWRRPPAKMAWLQTDNRIWWGKTGDAAFPMEKKFVSEAKSGVVNQTWWSYEFAGSTRNAGAEIKAIFGGEKAFATPKPRQLLDRILEMATDESSIILDSFAGSATTAHAVLAANAKDGGNRRFILVECEDYADTLTAERVRRVIRGYDFEGTQREELHREHLTFTSLKKADKLLDHVESVRHLEGHRFDKIEAKVKDGELIVTGERQVMERAEGLGGEFTYCTLGEPLEMDEGHKAISELAFKTLYGFNPCFVLELTATPKDVAPRGGANPRPGRPANILVEVSGLDLDREGMIKMPMNLEPRAGTDWHDTLAAAYARLNALDREARRFQGETGRTIRPILLVQVERTGADQRDGAHIHALDVKEWLTTAGLDEAEVAIKTADTNDLADPENLDLLAPTNRVRAIVTKQALQEGWDCPFAYVLCSLSASRNEKALTQLIGRILRQPQAQKTGVAALDECYVVTHHADTAGVVAAIKQGLEEDGLGDLVQEIRVPDPTGGGQRGPRDIPRRPTFAKTDIYLPQVLRVDADKVRELDYEQDILFALDWNGLDLGPLADKVPANLTGAERQMRRIRLADSGEERIVAEASTPTGEVVAFDPSYAVRMVADIVPNAWVARAMVGDLVIRLKGRGFEESQLGTVHGLLVQELRAWLTAQRDRMAEGHFRAEVAAGRIQFRLRTDSHNWAMPQKSVTCEPIGADQLPGADGEALRRSLFSPIYKGDLNEQEREVAVYLDGDKSLIWWHRNVAQRQYRLQGWRRERIYPDFIFAVRQGDVYGQASRLVVLEMKGEHLQGNSDTEYKQAVLRLMTEAFEVEEVQQVGDLELVHADGTRVDCDLVLMTEWQTRLPNEFLG